MSADPVDAPLPEPEYPPCKSLNFAGDAMEPLYTAGQLIAYAEAKRAALLAERDDMPPLHAALGPQEMSFAQFCRWHGLKDDGDVQAHIHAGLRSAPTTKTFKRFYERTLRELQDARDQSMQLYREAIDRGEICEPRSKTLEEKAAGLPELESTKAAIRLLEKRKARNAP